MVSGHCRSDICTRLFLGLLVAAVLPAFHSHQENILFLLIFSDAGATQEPAGSSNAGATQEPAGSSNASYEPETSRLVKWSIISRFFLLVSFSWLSSGASWWRRSLTGSIQQY